MSPEHGPAIAAEGLGKLYQLSHRIDRHTSLRDALTAAAMAPWRRFRSLSGSDASMEDFWAVRDVSFEVPQGEVVGIVGRNGAGKSTLLKILSRIVEPTEGSARLRGRVASLLEVGTGFHPELSGRENIYLNGSILGMKKREIDAKFDEIVDFAEIEKFLDTPVKRYSSGMYVRLAFAVAAHLEPEILIVDEVLAVGDAAFQKCLGKMRQISEQGGEPCCSSATTWRPLLIVNFRTGPLSIQCLASLAIDVSPLGPPRSVVVDNCSQDDSVTEIESAIRRNVEAGSSCWRCRATAGLPTATTPPSLAPVRSIHPGGGRAAQPRRRRATGRGGLVDELRTRPRAIAGGVSKDLAANSSSLCMSLRLAALGELEASQSFAHRLLSRHVVSPAPLRRSASAIGSRAPAWRSGAKCSMRSDRSTKASFFTTRRSTSAVARVRQGGRAGSWPTRGVTRTSRVPPPGSRQRGSACRPTGSRRGGASSSRPTGSAGWCWPTSWAIGRTSLVLRRALGLGGRGNQVRGRASRMTRDLLLGDARAALGGELVRIARVG